MSIDLAVQRLREANPIPEPMALRDLDEMDVFLAVTQQRSERMALDTKRREIKEDGPRRLVTRPVFALAAALVVVIGVLGVRSVFDGGPETQETAAPVETAEPVETLTPVSIGAAFVEAMDSWDTEAAMALLAPDAALVGEYPGRPEEYSGLFDWIRATEGRFTLDECIQTSDGPVRVRCSYMYQNPIFAVLGGGPYSGQYDFVIQEGQIIQVSNTNLYTLGPEWGVFRRWVTDNDLDAFGAMYTGGIAPELTPESIALWEEKVAEFVAEQEAGAG